MKTGVLLDFFVGYKGRRDYVPILAHQEFPYRNSGEILDFLEKYCGKNSVLTSSEYVLKPACRFSSKMEAGVEDLNHEWDNLHQALHKLDHNINIFFGRIK